MPRATNAAANASTRQKLIDAGKRLFGLHGFEATSTRVLAAAAGVNLAAIPYHFGGKEGLYHAVAQDIVASEKASLDPVFAHALAVGADPSAGRADVIEAMRSLVRVLVAELIGTEESQNTSQIMLQEQIAPTPAFHIFYDGVYRGAIEAWTGLLSRLTGLAPDSLELKLRALSILGQITIFRVGMAAVLRLMDRETLTPEHIKAVTQVVISQVEAIVAGLSPPPPEVAA
ncbi:MAG: CerR family C-terminal domain-containing protein [Desulfovibrio sp.]|nr:CerR family C-terminal domain-containing protein [Desulfovibrio sp.]